MDHFNAHTVHTINGKPNNGISNVFAIFFHQNERARCFFVAFLITPMMIENVFFCFRRIHAYNALRTTVSALEIFTKVDDRNRKQRMLCTVNLSGWM